MKITPGSDGEKLAKAIFGEERVKALYEETDSPKVSIEHGYKDERLTRLTRPVPGSKRRVLDTFQAMIELRLKGYDAFEHPGPFGKELWYRTVNGKATRFDGKPSIRVYGPNTVIMLINQSGTNPDSHLAPTETTYRVTKQCQPCPACGADALEVDGEWAFGVTLANGYTPARDELVKNHYSECQMCGWDQAS